MRPEVSVVSPIYGCKDCLEQLVERIEQVLAPVASSYEIILVDDASPDGAWSRISEIVKHHESVIGVRLSRNFGQHAAITAGLGLSRGLKVVVMDCDLQDRPEEIPNLLAALRDDTEIALAQRVQRQDKAFKRAGSFAFYKFLGWLTGATYDHTTANFGAYSRKTVDVIVAMPEQERFLPMLVRWTGLKTAHVPVTHEARDAGDSGYTLRRLLRLAASIALSYSDKPLRLVVGAALMFALLSIGVVAFSISRYWVGDTQVAGFTSIIASVWLIGSAILASVGVLGLYVGRIFSSAKQRPHYVISTITGHRQ